MTDPDEELEFGLELEGDDVLEGTGDYEGESDYPQVITNKWVYYSTVHRGKILCAAGSILLFLVSLAVITAIIVPLVIVFSGSDSEGPSGDEIFVVPPAPDMKDEPIRNTSEYQIVLSNLFEWRDREKVLAMWINEINNKFPEYFRLARKDGKTSAREQYKLAVFGDQACNSTWDFRVRDYVDGYGEGNTYIDIKASSPDQSVACSMPFWPSEVYAENSTQKCEQDIHQCSTKFSRDTRVFFDHHPKFTKCIDLLKMYPWAFENLLPENQHNTIERISPQHWWTTLYNGTIGGDSRYEMAWTLQYGTQAEALSGNGIPNFGEWSIRIFTRDDGLSRYYDAEAQTVANDLWQNLIDVFGNDDKSC